MRSRSLHALSLTALISTFSTLTVPAHGPAGDCRGPLEVYGGGGKLWCDLYHDFIELFNPTEAAVSLDGWSVEYFSAGGNSGGKAALSGAIPAGKHYLIQAGQGNGGSTPLPTPDAESSLNLSVRRDRSSFTTPPATRLTSPVTVPPSWQKAPLPQAPPMQSQSLAMRRAPIPTTTLPISMSARQLLRLPETNQPRPLARGTNAACRPRPRAKHRRNPGNRRSVSG